MRLLRGPARLILPTRVRATLRDTQRSLRFRRAMKQFRKDPWACTNPESPVVLDLVSGWGNKVWSARAAYLSACIEHALTTRGPVLECGSGLTTVVVGTLAKASGYGYWALEHSSEWADKLEHYLRTYELDSVTLCVSPLRDYGEYLWYEPPLESMPESFPLVLCDGPPGRTKGGRYGLAPVMRDRLGSGCTILLDDAHREWESAVAHRWEAELGATSRISGHTKPYIAITIGERLGRG